VDDVRRSDMQANTTFARSFATSALRQSKAKASVNKIWASAEEAVADVKGDSILLSGG